MAETRRVAFFGGQGSRSLFSSELISFAQSNARSSPHAAQLLSSCHAAFLDELNNSLSDNPVRFRDELKELTVAGNLISPPPPTHNNPIIQGVTLLLHQLLGYLANAEITASKSSRLEPKQGPLSETVGFCSGVLPAIVAASSGNVSEFIAFSRAATRVAFWLGYRAAEYGETQIGEGWRDRPWSLALSGYSPQVIEKYNADHKDEPEQQLCISARNSPSSFSVAGAGPALQKFRTQYLESNPDTSSDLVYVHALYHGGSKARSVVSAVLEDVSRRHVIFPTTDDLNVPLRSSITGTAIDSQATDLTLVEIAVQSILVDPIDWQTTWENISNSNEKTDVLAFGPHSKSLLATATEEDSVGPLNIIDLSGKGEKGIPSHADDSIAIVGMACQFPQGSNKEMLWQTLEQGLNTVEEIPESRFNVSQFHTTGEEKGAGRKMAARHGNFLDKPWAFDNKFFNVSPREAKSMDPQQRLLLQGALHALNDAGYVADSTPSFQKSTMGCYVGVATNDYENNLKDEIDVYYSTGTLRAFLSGKISHYFKWSGPSVVTDTACSASSVSLYQACRALRNGDCTAAIAGGVNAISSPDMYLGLSRAHFLSKTGQCKAFDITADGYCRSEGCGLFVLKKLKDALAENDRIYGVIRAVEVNQCGNAHSITHPHSETQQALFKQVLDRSGVDPNTVSVIEAHGTGTQAGDAAEISSIQSVFGNRPSGQPLTLTSVKGNIGHAEAASGAAGLSKLLMMLRKKKLPPQTGFKTINPRLASINAHNIKIPTSVEEWRTRRGVPRRALLNNFGAAGSNAAVLLEEAPEVSRSKDTPLRSAYSFNITARTPKAVKQYIVDWISQLEANPDSSIEDVTYTATARRMAFEQRLSLSCSSIEDLIQKLKSAGEPTSTANIKRKPIGFAFSGQGANYLGMGKELLATAPVFGQVVRQSDQILSDLGFPTVSPFIQGTYDAKSESEAVIVSQCSCFVVEYALARLWISWNIVPDIVMGHSLGEYAAMVTAGIISLGDGLKFVASRAKFMTELCEAQKTTMLACNMPSAAAEDIIKSKADDHVGLTVACQNTKGDCVLSGPHESLDNFSKHCKSAGFKCKKLEVPFGFHSAALDPILEPLSEVAASLTLSAPKIAFGSTVTGTLLEEQDITPEYFTKQTRETVLFADLMDSLVDRNLYTSATYIEIGPAPITLPMLKSGLSDGDSQFLPSLSNKQTPWTSLVSALNRLTAANYSINWRNVFDGTPASLIDAPEYPLDKTEMFVPYKEPTRSELAAAQPDTSDNPRCPLLPRTILEAAEGKDVFETDTELLARFIQGHVVGGVGLCPASLYHEMVLEAATNEEASSSATGETLVVSDISFDKPLIYNSEADKRLVRLTLDKAESDKSRRFTFASFVAGGDPKDNVTHCFGTLRTVKTSKLKTGFTKMAAVAKRQERHLDGMEKDTFHKRMLYETVFPRVVEYSKKYQSISNLTVAENGSEGHGLFKLPEPPTDEPFVLSPTFVDTLLHAAGFIANSHIDPSEACICTQVEQINILYDGLDQAQEFKVYCSLLDHIEGTLLGDAYAVTPDGTVVASVEGMHFKKLSLKGFQNHLARQAGRGRPQEKPTPSKKAPSRAGTVPPRGQPQPQNAGGVSTDEIVKAVTEIVSKVCEAPPSSISPQSELSDLGVDSLMQIELADALKQQFPKLDIDKNALLSSTSVKDLQDHIVAVSPSPQQRSESEKTRPMSLDLENTNERLQHAGEHTAEYNPPEAPANKVRGLIAEVCGIAEDDVDADATLESLGMDSLMTIELKAAFKKDLGIEMPDISGDFTVETLLGFAGTDNSEDTSRNPSVTDADSGFASPPSSMTSSMPSPTSTARPALPQSLQTGSKNVPPMYLFHDGSGTVGMYSRLSQIGCNLFGVANPSFGDSEHWAKSITDIAANYAASIAKSVEKSVVLGGWSFGGVVAFETAQHLRRLGKDVKGVILIDSPCPKNHQPLPQEVVQHILKPMTANNNAASQRSAASVATQFKQHAQMLGQYQPPKDTSDTPYVMLQSEQTFDTSGQCGVKYPWLEDQRARSQAIDGWQELLGRKVKTLKIPGDHFQPFTPECIGEVSEKLKEAYTLVSGA